MTASIDSNTYLSKLNDQQRAAVENLSGASLVIAGAGSGKTRVLTYKIVHLLNNGFEPYRILALTFTNKAAREMRSRITDLVGEAVASKIWMGTFHSIFLRILRRNADRIGFKPDFTIYDTTDSRSLIKLIIKELNLDDKIYKPNVVQNAISMAKNALVSPEAYANNRELMEADRRARRGEIASIYRIYRQRCHLLSVMDFDDILYYTNVLLRDNPDVREHYRNFFRYILVDEYQDTNFAQHLIVSQLCNADNNFCVVGDDAQSIYSFRGANIRNILNLKNSFPDLKIFKLEQNYRSTQNIINAANSLIQKNKEQIPKQVFSKNDVGLPIDIVKSYSDLVESVTVAARISQRRMETGDSFEDFAILYRTNAQSRILEESLRKQNIPYRIYGGLSFYQRKEVKDAVAYFRLAVNPDDDEALRRIINIPARGIGDTTLNKIITAGLEHRLSAWGVLNNLDKDLIKINSDTRRKLDDFRELIDSFVNLNNEGMAADELATRIIRQTRLLSSLMTDNTPESISKQENLQEVLNGVKEFVQAKVESGEAIDDPSSISLAAYLGQVSLQTDQDQKDNDDGEKERVTLMTVHAAKGLEFNNVIIVGAEEELFPSAMSSGSAAEIEEERRLMYVAITRAKHYCMISYAESRYRNGQTAITRPSRFINEISRQFIRRPLGNNSYSDTPRFNPVDRYRDSFHSPAPAPRPSGRSAVDAYNSSIAKSAPAPPSNSAPISRGEFTLHHISELSVGMKVMHDRFGQGTIIEIDNQQPNERIIVKFRTMDTKVLLLKFARFKIIE